MDGGIALLLRTRISGESKSELREDEDTNGEGSH